MTRRRRCRARKLSWKVAAGLITVAGGKFTTHREIAQKLVDRVMRALGRASGVCPTLETPLPGARALADGDGATGVDAKYSGRSRRRF